MQHKVSGEVAEIAITVIQKKSKKLNGYVESFIGDTTFEDSKDIIPSLMSRLSLLMFDQEYIWDHRTMARCGRNFIRGVLGANNSGQDMPGSVNKSFIRMLIWTMQRGDLVYMNSENRLPTVYNDIASSTLMAFADKHVSNNNSDVCIALVPAILKQKTHEEKSLANASIVALRSISIQAHTL
ncbi:uncharacterized protein [Argopecten irradians]|uniref:uncharacterized protein n=1 Tax=Argopecten irradians TaxID=31199 RepID=UPI0037109775